MECAKIIYKILIEFEKQLDNYEFDIILLDYKLKRPPVFGR